MPVVSVHIRFLKRLGGRVEQDVELGGEGMRSCGVLVVVDNNGISAGNR